MLIFRCRLGVICTMLQLLLLRPQPHVLFKLLFINKQHIFGDFVSPEEPFAVDSDKCFDEILSEA